MFEKFQQIIDEKNITIYRVAADTDIPTTSLYDWKSGKSTPKYDKMKRIALYLGVSVEELM